VGWLNTLTFGLLGEQSKQVGRDGTQMSDFTMSLLGFSESPDRGDDERLDAFHASSSLHIVQHVTSQRFATPRWTVTRDGEPQPDHPLQQIIDHPNPEMSGYTYRYIQQSYRDLLGESFAEITESESDDRPLDLWPIPPTAVTLRKQKGGQMVAEIDFGDRRDVIPTERLIWSKKPDLRNPYARGTGIGEVVSQEIDGDEFAQDFVNAFFHNDATPRTMFGFPRGSDKNKVRQFEQKVKQRHRGGHKSHQFMAHMMGDGLSVEQLSTDFKHLDVTELRQFLSDVIRRVYNIPPAVVGQTESQNLAKAKMAREHMAQYNTLPRLRMQRQEWVAKLKPLLDAQDVGLDFEDPTPSKRDHRLDVMSERPEAYTVNEWRELSDHPPREDGDAYLRPPETKLQPVDAGDLVVEGKAVSALPDLTDEAELVDKGADVIDFPVEVGEPGPIDHLKDDLWDNQRDHYLEGGG